MGERDAFALRSSLLSRFFLSSIFLNFLVPSAHSKHQEMNIFEFAGDSIDLNAMIGLGPVSILSWFVSTIAGGGEFSVAHAHYWLLFRGNSDRSGHCSGGDIWQS